MENLTKITQETLEMMKSAQDLNKAITLATGLQGYNLEAPAKQLVPFLSPLRNVIPRKVSKTGSSVHWKAITAINAAGKTTALEGTRGNGVSYTTVDKLAAFKVISLQDSVSLEAEAAGRNFDNVKALSATNLLLRVMTEEEKLILGGNSSSLGTVSAPVVSTATSGGSIAAGTYSVKCAALTLVAANRISLNRQIANLVLGVQATDSNNNVIAGAYDGVTAASAAGSVTTTGSASTITATVTPVTGALAYAWFVGTAGNETLQIVTTNSFVTLTSLVSGGTAAPTADGSGDPLSFDGIIPQIIAGGGYLLDKGNTQLTKDSGGVQELDDLNSYLFNTFKIGPTRYLVSEQLHKDITAAVIAGAGAPTLFVNNAEKNDITGNYLVRQYVNKSYGGQIIKIESHPWLPNGTIIAMSETVPYPNANIPSVMEIECGYDYRQIEYAFTSPKYEFEVRTYEALKHYFPAAQAIITNVKPGIV